MNLKSEKRAASTVVETRPGSPTIHRWWIGSACGCAAAALLVVTQFPAAGNDDSHITYWSAHALANLGGVLNYNGDVVEQSSSLLMVLILAVLAKISGASMPLIGWLVSIAAAVAGIITVGRVSHRLGLGSFWPPIFLGTFLPYIYWSTSGMEMTLSALLGCVAVACCGALILSEQSSKREVGIVAAVTCAFLLVRPESPFVLVSTLAFGVAVLGFRFARERTDAARHGLVRAAGILGGVCLVVAILVGVRYAIFGLPFPSSAASKTGAFSLGAGLQYLGKGLALSGTALGIAAAFAVALTAWQTVSQAVDYTLVLLTGLGLALVCFVIGSGGDWMPGARLLTPVAPILALLAGKATHYFAGRHRLLGIAIAAAVVVANVNAALAFGSSKANGSYRLEAARDSAKAVDPATASAFAFSELGNKAHRRDARLSVFLADLIEKLSPTSERPVYIMSGQAGMVPYYAFKEYFGRARFVDLWALTARDVLPCVPSRERRNQIHGIKLSAAFIIRKADQMDPSCRMRRPDIVFSTGAFPKYLKDLGYVRVYQGPTDMHAFVALDGQLEPALRGGQVQLREAPFSK